MRLMSLLVIPLLACASAQRAAPPERDTKASEVSQTGAPSDMPPWMIAAQWAFIGEAPANLVADGELRLGEAEGISTVYRSVAKEVLPDHLRALVGQRFAVVSDKGRRGCDVVVSNLALGVFLTDSDPGYHMLFEESEYDEEGNVVREVPAQERFARAIEGRSLDLIATLTDDAGEPFSGCTEDDFIAHHLTPTVGRPMTLGDATGVLRAKVLAAFREHGFWEVQQTNFQKSVEALRKQSREAFEADVAEARKSGATPEEIAEIYRDERADQASATWDKVENDDQGDAYSGNYVAIWRDTKGVDRFALAIIGNDESCAAPRSWMLFRIDGETLVTLDFDIRGSPSGVVEQADGTVEVLHGTWDPRSIRRLDGDGLVTHRAHTLSSGLHCSYGQIPPLGN